MALIRLNLIIVLTILSFFSLSSQTNLVAPFSKDKLLTIVNDQQDYALRLVDLKGVILTEKSLGSLNELTIRSIQFVGDNIFFIDGKRSGFRVKVEGNNLLILEKREVPFDVNGLENYFFFFTPKKEVHVQYASKNTVKAFIYDENKELIYSDYSSFTVKTNKDENGEFPRLIFQPNSQILTLSSKSNNIWHSIDLSKNNFTQRFYGILPSGKKGMLYRMFDPFSNSQYQIIANQDTYEVYKVNNFNSVIPLKDNQFLLGTVEKLPLFIFDNCVYFADRETKGFGKKCF